MGSLVPFQDLNLLPDPPMTATITPKIEPKLEPTNEPSQTPVSNHPQRPQPLPTPELPNSTPEFFLNSPHTPQTPSPDGGDQLFSEFHRVSELFRNAFARRYGRGGGDVSVLDPETLAIVPVKNEEAQLSPFVASPSSGSRRLQLQPRSSELVRVANLSDEEKRYFREEVRQARLIYDSLRVFYMTHEEGLDGRMRRGDLAAASMMRGRGLWVNRDKRIVGPLPGIEIGDVFFYRMELCVVGLHGQPQAGIDYLTASQSSNGEPIATSVIVSGGYEDDEDAGDVIIYTGHGGQDKLNRQRNHQKLEGGNLAMERSMHYGIEVRVIRGIRYGGGATPKIYVYDGLYRILECWFDVGKSGFGVYKYKLMRIQGQPEMGSAIMRFAQTLRTRPLTVRPRGYLSLDISERKECMPVFLFNDIDSDSTPLYYDYLARTAFPPYLMLQNANGGGCECVLSCGSNCFCASRNGGEFAYDHNGILIRGKPIIFECGPFCKCPPTCRNRVTQKGLSSKLEIFRSKETNWGVRTLDLIQAGAFICEYAGVALTRDQAQIFSMSGDPLVYPSRFTAKWTKWGDLSKVFPDCVRPAYPSIPPLDFAMDVSKMRNVACYISHSSISNVMVQYVLYEHSNVSFPHIMLFAMENIPPLRELSLDYGAADEWTGKPPLLCN
ncbi:histone-lysine N-methyltransferase family member SUVH9 [Rhodamnia argentea]|uniref:Histone-lysine N-methyltransferase family member SUVH9 n=1 Tax=Rhodamnia argentea TaxID=178133 RepID=A0A8B8QW48_9MYRT|nr:histone-lysine N-methyltransferase family member SUVH9 [Rhodamnia argentea]XP_048135790.1 histone-lysine N-methyltransferase family member SUVH9 [Rhodamnia argentea]XP_048135794.1 histone-lysine N-methyltransferase family member SUVH9 [Rhodamnia argentea]XP_048135799.1 histone-lysine N-methyltransferase family member SUVH9 [Rhodamnia argentea]